MVAEVAEEIIRAEFPEKVQPLFEPYRYKILKGGRGSAKSWSVARALLLAGRDNCERILCTREIQNSIKDSVHKLLSDQIEELGLSAHYQVLETEIRGINGTEFIFSGLQGHTINSIKSFEGVTKVWVEEAQTVKKKSWDILIPTIRAEGSEIWITYNPELDTDETHVRFAVNPPPNSIVIEMNYTDNPWFSKVLEQERAHCQATEPEEYANIWLGQCRATVAGAIYARQVVDMLREKRYCRAPYDPLLRVHTVWDLGHNDHMSVGLFQNTPLELRMIAYIEDRLKTIDEYFAQLNTLPYNWGWDFLPHDGYIKTAASTAGSCYDIGRKMGRRVAPMVDGRPPIPPTNVEVRIKAVKVMCKNLVINELDPGTKRFMECFKRYRRAIPKHGEPAAPVHDEFSHGMDMLGHAALIRSKMKNDEINAVPKLPGYRPADAGMGALG